MTGYEEVKNPVKVRVGDLLVVGKKSGLRGLASRTYSRLGLHNGASRGDNDWNAVKWFFVDHEFDPLVMYVSRVHRSLTEISPGEGSELFANEDDFDPNPSADRAVLHPLNVSLSESFGRRAANPSITMLRDLRWAYQTSCLRDLVKERVLELELPVSVVIDKTDVADLRVMDAVDRMRDDGRCTPYIPTAESYGPTKVAMTKAKEAGKVTGGLVDCCFIDGYFPGQWTDDDFKVSTKFLVNAVARGAILLRPADGTGIAGPLAKVMALRMLADFASSTGDMAVEMQRQSRLLVAHSVAMGRRNACLMDRTAAMPLAVEELKSAMVDFGKAMN